MPATYTIRVQTEFAAAHKLRNYPGDCSRLHGHNWKVEIEVVTQVLDSVGMGIDFRELRRHARSVSDQLDHRYLNEIAPFDECNPTAENIAAHFHRELSTMLRESPVTVTAVTIWENERSCVRYSEQEA